MNDFEPSQNFVSATMKRIRAYENRRNRMDLAESGHPLSGFIRRCIPAGGILFAIFNLLRMYFALYKPVLCF